MFNLIQSVRFCDRHKNHWGLVQYPWLMLRKYAFSCVGADIILENSPIGFTFHNNKVPGLTLAPDPLRKAPRIPTSLVTREYFKAIISRWPNWGVISPQRCQRSGPTSAGALTYLSKYFHEHFNYKSGFPGSASWSNKSGSECENFSIRGSDRINKRNILDFSAR